MPSPEELISFKKLKEKVKLTLRKKQKRNKNKKLLRKLKKQTLNSKSQLISMMDLFMLLMALLVSKKVGTFRVLIK